MLSEGFIPETHEINLEDSGSVSSHFDQDCSKKENHAQYKKLKDLTLDALPLPWRDESVLKNLKQIGDRVVHLTVLQLSPSRQDDQTKTSMATSRRASRSSGHSAVSHEGSGFLTFDLVHGPVVHTSKHVVRDRFEAERTVVRLFYDDDKATSNAFATLRGLRDKLSESSNEHIPVRFLLELLDRRHRGIYSRDSTDAPLYAADGQYFESFIFSDYTAFSCDRAVGDLFTKWEKARSHPSFSYVKAGNKRLVLGPQLNVAIISHPHGMPKAIAFGKMKPLARLLPAMYNAATCPGSSGAPFIRLHSNTSYKSPTATILKNTISTNCTGQHFISAGLFVHHGFYPQRLKLGMGTVRPPTTLTFPSRCSWREMLCWVVNTFSLCEDFLLYWMLLMFDHEQVEPFIKAHLTMFTIIVPLAGVIFSLHADLLRVLWTGFWMHITCSVLHRFVQGPHITPVLCGTFSAAFSILMCVIGWSLLQCAPQPLNIIGVSVLWLLTLCIEWYFSFHKWFFDWFIRTFRLGKLIPGEESGGRRISESQSFSSVEQDAKTLCERWYQDCRERCICWGQGCQLWIFQCALNLQKTTALTLISIIFSINWTLLGIIWTAICLYICSSCLRGARSSIPVVEDAIFKGLARQIDKVKQTRVGRYLQHFFPIPSDIRGAFHGLVRGSCLTETIYGPVTFFLGPAILLAIWTALLIEPPPLIAVVLFLLQRRPVYGIKPSYSQEFSVTESTDAEDSCLSDNMQADLETAIHFDADLKQTPSETSNI